MNTFMSASLETALRQAVGTDNVYAEAESALIALRYEKNVSGLHRQIKGVVVPKSTVQVQQIVSIANAFSGTEKVALYPISQGKNWGLGSKLPVRDGAIIIDLSSMNRIHEINEEFGYAVIEPGVTQQQLYDALQRCSKKLVFNVTGSGTETSIIGNCLERGVGYLASRAEDISNLEVVLGSGDVIRSGFSHYPVAQAQHLYKYGIGPDLSGLFIQSNFGIVTRATFELSLQAEQQAAILCGLRNGGDFENFIDQLAELRRNAVIQTAFHIGNTERLRSTLVPKLREQLPCRQSLSPEASQRLAEDVFNREMKNAWSAIGTVQGTKKSVVETFRQVKQAMAHFGEVRLITDSRLALARRICKTMRFWNRFALKLPFLESLESVYGLTKGIPTDMPLKGLASQAPQPTANYLDLDDSCFGLLFTTPLLPMSGACAKETLELTRSVFGKYNYSAYITFNMCNAKTFEGVINLVFDRNDPHDTEIAHQCIQDLTQRLFDKGYIPYRIGIQGMSLILNEKDLFWQLLKKLKEVLDPNNLIAPGRYNLL